MEEAGRGIPPPGDPASGRDDGCESPALRKLADEVSTREVMSSRRGFGNGAQLAAASARCGEAATKWALGSGAATAMPGLDRG